MDDLLDEPADVQNFLARYHEARASARASSLPTTPTLSSAAPPPTPPSPSSPLSPAASASSPPAKHAPPRAKVVRDIWESVFHPLGKSPTGADRYDLSRGQRSAPGMSASEMHAKGSGISLDTKNDDE